MDLRFCPRCFSYMLDITDPSLKGWKKCPGCKYCHDSEGYNKLNSKPTLEESSINEGRVLDDNNE